MHSESEIRQALREWILSKAKGLDAVALTDTTPLFKQRYLRSLHVPELLLLLERLRGEPIDVENLGAGDFRDIDTLMATFCGDTACADTAGAGAAGAGAVGPAPASS